MSTPNPQYRRAGRLHTREVSFLTRLANAEKLHSRSRICAVYLLVSGRGSGTYSLSDAIMRQK